MPEGAVDSDVTIQGDEVPKFGKVLASQAAFRDKLSEQSDTQYYDPFQPREKVRDVIKSYRQLIQDTTGMLPS